MSDSAEDYCKGDYVCSVCGINKKELQRLISSGVIPKEGYDKFHAAHAIRAYVDYLKKQSSQPVGQKEIAAKVDLSERKLREKLKELNIDHKTSSVDEIVIAYIKDLRAKAAGRAGDVQGMLAEAKTRDALAGAKLKEIQFHTQIENLVPADEVEIVMSMWAISARGALNAALDKFVVALEGHFNIEIPAEIIDDIYRPVYKAISRTAPTGNQVDDQIDDDVDSGEGAIEMDPT